MSNRIKELDSLRGIAALTVVMHHCMLVFPAIMALFFSYDVQNATAFQKAIYFSPVHSFWNGHAAVVFFFVLSGFVLAIPFYNSKEFSYKKYFIKRVCRLYIPYIVIVTISILLLNFYHKNHGVSYLSSWFNDMWKNKITWRDYLRFLVMSISMSTHNVDTTVWSINVELKMSLILPFFHMIIRRLSFWKNIAFALGWVVFYHAMIRTGLFNKFPELSVVYFLSFFLFGSILYKYRMQLSTLKIWSSKLSIVVMATITILLYNWDWLLAWVLKYNEKSYIFLVKDYVVAVASCLAILIALLPIPVVRRILNYPVTMFLGKISYSLYLIHPVIILCVVYALKDILPYIYILPIIIAVSIVFSYIYYLLVEKNSIKLGNRLTSRAPTLVLNN